MSPIDVLTVGNKYSKKELSGLIDQPSLSTVREGVFSCQNSDSYLLFVDLEKQGKEARFHFEDFFDEDFFHWDSQTTQHIKSPKIQEIVNGDRITHLFVRIVQKIKNQTQPFVYCGRLEFVEYEEGTSKPVHIIFQNIDYDDLTKNEDLIDIYLWNPGKIGKTSKSKITKKGIISKERQANFRKPDHTERSGLVVSRVGQGYYRQQIIKKWKGQCPITGISIKSILISSHIVPWSESNDVERLDVDNGILLSPNFDALFDRHLITFNDYGSILISKLIPREHLDALGLSNSISIPVSNGMIPYLKRHRERFLLHENDR